MATAQLRDLPVELLSLVIEQIVLLYLAHPRKVCLRIPALLKFRFVSQTFSKDISHHLHSHITLPNLPNSLFSHYNSHTFSSQPSLFEPTARNTALCAYLASALYNSCLSLRKRHVGTAVTKYIKECVQITQEMEKQFSAESGRKGKNEILKTMCTVIASSPNFHRRIVVPTGGFRARVDPDWRSTDAACIAAIFGYTSFVISTHQDAGNRYHGYTSHSILGSPILCAIEHNRTDIVRYLLQSESNPGTLFKPGVIERLVARGKESQEILEMVLGTWIQSLELTRHSITYLHREQYQKFIELAVRTTGDVDVLQCILEAPRNGHYNTEKGHKFALTRFEGYAFLCAVREGRENVVKWLVDGGVDVNLQDGEGICALAIAKTKGWSTIEGLLREHGAKDEVIIETLRQTHRVMTKTDEPQRTRDTKMRLLGKLWRDKVRRH